MRELVEKSLKQVQVDENMRIWVKNNIVVHGKVAYVADPPGGLSKTANYAKIHSNVKVKLVLESRKEML